MDLRTVLPCDASSVGTARKLVRRQLSKVDDPDLVDDASLLVSELVTNAILHGHTEVSLRAGIRHGVFRAEISDGNPTVPVPRRPSQLAGNGRGLLLIDEVANRWGVKTTRAGKTVWFELAL
jgi:anti-sigma regulatory factor (Ser/Thr protein kinase)